ncbi:MAG: alpha/beta hydrolase [Microbacterium sp.]
MSNAPGSEVPAWYTAALGRRPARDVIDEDGTTIAIRSWGPESGMPVVLVHGGAAHAGWWDHIAPLLEGCRVVAMDLSGHGDSAWREEYRMATWRDEVLAVLRSGHVRGRPLLVGHSMGGFVGYATARSNAEELAGLLIVDSYFPRREEGESWRSARDLPRRIHPDRQTVLDRFRLVPAAPPRAPYVMDHIARGSVTQVDDGWSWKFDPRVFAHEGIFLEDIEPITGCPVAVVRGDAGLLDDEGAAILASLVDGTGPAITIADCGHHVPIDQPVALAATIAAAAKAWASHAHLTVTTMGGS